MHKLSHLTFLL